MPNNIKKEDNMTEKEIAEIRRRYRKEKSNITRICGCFVNEKKEIISELDQSVGLMPVDDADALLSTLKKTLSGNIGRNLIEIEFSTNQVDNSEEHRLLSGLRDTALKDKELVAKLYEKIISSYEYDGNYMIMVAHDRYDVFKYSADGEKGESGEMFSYIICAVCPIKPGKTSLSYYVPGNCFRTVCADTMLCSPELGFMFPAMIDGGANIYGALYYTKDLCNSHDGVVDALFDSALPMPAAEQKETFGSVLREAMEEDCSMKVVRSVYNQMNRMIEEHKEQKIEEPLVMSCDDAASMLRRCGVPETRVETFEEKYTSEFGENTEINPKNVAVPRMQVKTPEVTIKVSPGCGELVETRIIDGVRYILVRADKDVQVNGIDINI